jgi:monoamine oxidase
MCAELGAARIPLNHDLTLGYAKEFGLELTPFYPDGATLAGVHFMRGTRVRLGANGSAPLSAYPISVTPEERDLGLAGIGGQAIGGVLSTLGDPRDPAWPLGPAREYDAMTWAEFLRGHGVSDDVAAVMGLGFSERGGSSRSAAWMLREIALAAQGSDLLKIVGGNDRLPLAFAQRLSEVIRYGHEVTRIERSDSGVRVFFEHRGERGSLRGDRAVCALPFPIVRGIEIVPDVSEAKRRAIDGMSYGPLSRATIQVDRKYWETEGLSGFARTDQVAEIFHPTWDQDGERGLIQLYMKRELTERANGLDEAGRLALAIERIDEVFPGLRAHAEGGTCMCWDMDPHTRCTVAALNPGQMVGMLPYAGTPEGRLHFAGEHTSAWHGWMQGALASGVRTAHEIHEA